MKKIIFTLGALAALSFSCQKNNQQTDFTACNNPTYEGSLKSLIDNKCATSGCHAGSVSPNLTSYSQVKNAADNGSLYREVIDRQTMPEGMSFSQEEYDSFNCWLNAGAPEK